MEEILKQVERGEFAHLRLQNDGLFFRMTIRKGEE